MSQHQQFPKQHAPPGKGNENRAERPTGLALHPATNLKAYLDGELPLLRRWLVRGHLACCANCRKELIWLTRLGHDMRDFNQATPRPELRARILASLPDTLPQPSTPLQIRRRTSLLPIPALLLPVSALALAALVGTFAWTHWQTSHVAPAPAPIDSQNTLPQNALVRRNEVVSPLPSARTNDPFADHPSQTAPPAQTANYDPFAAPETGDLNAEADALFKERWQQTEHEHPRPVPAPKRPVSSPPFFGTMQVADLSSAQEQIVRVAQAAGGQTTLVIDNTPPSNTSPGAPQNGSASLPGTPNAVRPYASVATRSLELHVPANRASAVLKQLNQVGKVQPAAKKSGMASDAPIAVQPHTMPSSLTWQPISNNHAFITIHIQLQQLPVAQ